MVRNVAMLCRLFTPHSGGVEKHVELLSKELLKRGHSIVLITEQYSLDLPLEEIIDGVRVVRIPYFALNSKRLVWTWMCEHENLFADADLVHVHDVFWWYWPIHILLLFKPVFITFHGYEGSEPPTKKAIIQRKISEIFFPANSIPAKVPGTIYSDLVDAGILDDGLYNDFNDVKYRWVSYANWTYVKSFDCKFCIVLFSI